MAGWRTTGNRISSLLPLASRAKNKLENENIQLRDNVNKSNNNIYSMMLKTKEANKLLYRFQIKHSQTVFITWHEKWYSYFENETLKWDYKYLNNWHLT